MVNTKGLSKAEVLAALYNASHPQGMGLLFAQPGDMSIEEAEEIAKSQDYFDYLKGRVMKVDLSDPDGFDERLYERDNGYGSADRAIMKARDKKAAQNVQT